MKGECSYPGLWKLENISAYSVIIALQINTQLVPAEDLSWGCRQDGQESRHLEAWLRLEGLLPTLLPSTLAMSCLRVLSWEPASPTADIWEGPQGGSHRASNDLVWGSCPFTSTVLCWVDMSPSACTHKEREMGSATADTSTNLWATSAAGTLPPKGHLSPPFTVSLPQARGFQKLRPKSGTHWSPFLLFPVVQVLVCPDPCSVFSYLKCI